MKLSELNDIINRLIKLNVNSRNSDAEVKIAIKKPFQTVGGLPMIGVKTVQMGFDWEAGNLIIRPEENLMQYDIDFGEKFRQLEQKYATLYNENRHLKTEVKRLKKMLTV